MKKNDTNKKNMSSSAKGVRGVSNVRPKTKRKKKNSNRKRRTNNIKKMKEKQIVVKRSSGRREKFDTNRMAQTVSRSGVPFLMARDVAKNVSKKIRKQNSLPKKRRNNQHNISRNAVDPIRVDNEKRQTQKISEDKTVTASQIRGLVASELRDRNRGDIAASYVGETPENTLGDRANKQNKSDRISLTGATQHTRQPANRNRVIHDMSKRGGGIST